MKLQKCGQCYSPATQAVMKQASVPAIKARSATRDSNSLLLGASTEMPPICTPIDAKLAKPHKAYVQITSERI